MTTRKEILEAVNSGFAEMEERIESLEAAVQAAVAPKPEMPDAPEAQDAGPKFKLEEYYANQFTEREAPFTGERRIAKDYFGDPGYTTHFQFKLTAIDGDIVIKSAEASEPTGVCQPKFDPIEMKQGRVIKQGSWMIFRCRSKLTGRKPGDPLGIKRVSYRIAIEDGTEAGQEIIDLTAAFSSTLRPRLDAIR